MPLSCQQKDYELKSQNTCELDEKSKNIFEVERNLRVRLIDCLQKQEAVIMKKTVKKEESSQKIKKITTKGIPSFDAYTASEQKALFSTLLLSIVAYYKDKGGFVKK